MFSLLTLKSAPTTTRRTYNVNNSDVNSLQDCTYLYKGMTINEEVKSQFSQLENCSNAYGLLADAVGDVTDTTSYEGQSYKIFDASLYLPNCENCYKLINSNTRIRNLDVTVKNMNDDIMDNPYLLSANITILSETPNVNYYCKGNSNLKTLSFNLSNGVSLAYYVSANNPNLQTFNFNAPLMKEYNYSTHNTFFIGDTTITELNCNLPSLIKGDYMFNGASNLPSISMDLPSLTSGKYMFSNCSSLRTFTGSLKNLTDATYMFNNTGLEYFYTDDLSNLSITDNMFNLCNLAPISIRLLAYLLPSNSSSKSIKLPIKLLYNNSQIIDNSNTSSTQAALTDFANQAGFSSWSELRNLFSQKNWSVSWCYGTTNTQLSGNYS